MTTKSTTSRTEQTISNLQFWLNPEYHNYHVGAVAAVIREAIVEIESLEREKAYFQQTIRNYIKGLTDETVL